MTTGEVLQQANKMVKLLGDYRTDDTLYKVMLFFLTQKGQTDD